MPTPTRKDDEMLLHMLDMHEQGMKPEQIAKVLGTTPRSVRDRIARAIAEDCLHDPDAETHWKGPTT